MIEKTYISFDQFQRYQTATNLIEFFRKNQASKKFKILELGANEHKDLGLFLQNDDILYTDVSLTESMQADEHFQKADGTQLNFPDRSFDFVVALDVLEHIPEEKRKLFLENANRVAKKGAIISFPYNNKLVYETEERVNTFYKTIFGYDFIWLKEHMENGLPDIKQTLDIVKDYPHFLLYHGSLDIWEKMWYTHFQTVFAKETSEYRVKIDNFYNTNLYRKDNKNICYRAFLILAKENKSGWENYANSMFEGNVLEDDLKKLDLLCSTQNLVHNLHFEKKSTDLFQKLSKNLDVILNEKKQELINIDQALSIAKKEKQFLASDLNRCQNECTQLRMQRDILNNQVFNYEHAFFWRITKPLRVLFFQVKKLAKINRHIFLFAKGLRSLYRNGFSCTFQMMRDRRNLLKNKIIYTVEDLKIQRNYIPKKAIKFSVLVPLYNTPEKFLKEMLESVQNQTYANWELCLADGSDSSHEYVKNYCLKRAKKDTRIKYKKLKENLGISENSNACIEMSTGDYIALLDHDDILHPSALFENARAIEKTDALVLYSDEDHITEQGQHINPFYKPDWSPDLLYSQNYITHFLVFNKDLFDKIGRFRAEYDGAQDYDLILRLSAETNRICHIPQILYSWRESSNSTSINSNSKPYAHIAGLKALDNHLRMKYGKDTYAEETPYTFVYHARFGTIKENPLVSIIIPTKDKWKLTEACVQSILEKSTYQNYEILILDNNSLEEKTLEWFNDVQMKDFRVKVLKTDIPFNWSKINNFGISASNGEVCIFLNNDTMVITPDWIERLCENALREDVGVVGPLLLYDDETIQHAGVVLGMNGWADHVFKNLKPIHKSNLFISPVVSRNVLAVTGACMAISKKTLQKIGLFDEDLVICGSDIEICLRAHEHGFFNLYNSAVKLFHLESKSRDSFIPEIDFYKSKQAYSHYLKNGDPFFNVHLDLFKNKPTLSQGCKCYNDFINYMCTHLTIENKSKIIDDSTYQIMETTPLHVRKSRYAKNPLRLNLLIPTLNRDYVFGGISTALNFFDELQKSCNCDVRILVEDTVNLKNTVQLDGYFLVNCDSEYTFKKQIISTTDRLNKTLPVHGNDIFMATGWWTAYTISSVIKWQSSVYSKPVNPLIYFIQDYEPGFYAWSSRYLMAESTYKLDLPVFAIFNSTQLREFFDKNNYKFKRQWCFDPTLHKTLSTYLKGLPNLIRKKKQILIYGRPGTARNAFEIVVASLKRWCELQPDRSEWTLLSVGEKHSDIDLGYGMILHSLGKLTIEEYAQVLRESFAGISLMVSPHPSYPPLEMAAFGVKTITNMYANKDLSAFSENIFSMSECSQESVAYKLRKICENFDKDKGQGICHVDGSYLETNNNFGDISKGVFKELDAALRTEKIIR